MSDISHQGAQAGISARQQDFFFEVFDKSSVGMAIVSQDKLTFQAANEKFCAITAYPHDELIEKCIADLIQTGDSETYANEMRQYGRDELTTKLRRKVAYIRKDGRATSLTESITPIDMPGDATNYMLVSVEESSTHNGVTNFLTSFLAHTTDEIWATGADNRILLANRAFCVKHGIPAGNIGTADSANLIQAQSSADMSMHRAVLETGSTRRQVLSYTLADGKKQMYFTVKFPIALGPDNQMAVGTIATDISALSQSATEIREKDFQIRQITDSLHVMIFQLDAEMKFKYMNKTGEDWWQVPITSVIGKHYSELVGEELFEKRRPFLEQTMESGETVSHEAVTTYPDGKTRNVYVTYIPQKSKTGKRLGFYALIEDVTERKRIEEQFSRTSKLEGIGQLAAGIAHEINTPIQYIGDNLSFLREASEDLFELVNAISVYTEATKSGGDIPKALQDIEDIQESIDINFLRKDIPEAIDGSLKGVSDVARIVLSMKDFSRPTSKEKTPVDVNSSLRNTLTISRSEWKDIATIHEELAENLPAIPGYPGELNQVFLNIIINAAHAIAEKKSPDMGVISVQTAEKKNAVEVRITDSGNGLPVELHEKVFEPFFTTKDVGKGTGQGLAISWDIVVNKHGGTIEIEAAPGGGTTFIVTLPA